MEDKFKDKEPEDLFREIYAKCKALGISTKKLSGLTSVKKLKAKRKSFRNGVFYWLLAALVLLSALFVSFGLQPVLIFAKFWFYLRGLDIENEACFLDIPLEVQDIFMPPFDCSICRNLSTIQKVSNISPEEFEQKFAYSTVPVIITDGTRNWTAVEKFNVEFFQNVYLGYNHSSWKDERECQFFPYKTEFTSLYEVLTMNAERAKQPWYIGWSNCDSKIGNVLRKHYQRPYFLPLQSESVNVDWIFMGTPGYGSHMHIDRVHNPSWQAQIKGRKQWTLEPVPECYNDCKTIESVVEPGEIIVLDTNRWYHKTLITGADLSISIGSEFD